MPRPGTSRREAESPLISPSVLPLPQFLTPTLHPPTAAQPTSQKRNENTKQFKRACPPLPTLAHQHKSTTNKMANLLKSFPRGSRGSSGSRGSFSLPDLPAQSIQPLPLGLPIRAMLPHQPPETHPVIHMNPMTKLMNHHIFPKFRRHYHQPPA